MLWDEKKMNNETEQIFLLNPSELQPLSATQKETAAPAGDQVNLENIEDFSTVCRTCATITEFVIPIFSGEGLQNNLADKIHKHLPIKVSEEDSLPRAVCYQCAHTLLAWHELEACCRQADQALTTRLQQLQRQKNLAQQDPKPIGNEDSQIIENTPQNEFEGIASLVVPPEKAPPEYPASPAPPPLTSCPYCPTQHPPADYKDHLIQAHTELFFHCDECDGYVDRKDFILHMSLHVVQYSSDKKKDESKKPSKKKRKVKDENENTETCESSDVATERNEEELLEIEIPGTVSVAIEFHKMNNEDQNEFSDHSDTDFNFGPLPESVFTAIEDSQDSQPVDIEPTTTPEVIEGVVEGNVTENDIENDAANNKTDTNMNQMELKSAETTLLDQNTENKNKKIRKCHICGKVYTASSSYFYHMKSSHKKTRDHECELCGRKFWTKVVLTQHMNTHSNICENECKICGKKLKSKSSLYIHTQNHIGTKKFSCEQCQISFRWRTHLLRHIKRHSAEKPHICATCGRGFTIRCDLLRHIRTHSAGKYECKKCGVCFAQARYLKAHVDKKHSSQAAEINHDVPVTTEAEVTKTSQGFC